MSPFLFTGEITQPHY